MKTISDTFFIYFHNSEMILWDYKNHEQYRIKPSYVEALFAVASGQKTDSMLASELEDAGLIKEATPTNRWRWDIISRIFNHGTKNIPISSIAGPTPEQWVDEYLEYCEQIGPAPIKPDVDLNSILKLPSPDLSLLHEKSLYDVLKKRKTCRSFNGSECPQSTLSDILFTTFGHFHGDWNGEFIQSGLEALAVRKTSPSGGGLHCVEVYPIIWNVEGISPGVYKYHPKEHALTKVAPSCSEDEFINLVWGQYYAKGMAFGVFLTGNLAIAAWKYKHSRAYRNVLLDVGHISQTMQLTATAFGLKTWITGAFNDSGFEKLLNLDEESEAGLFFVGCGHADGESQAFDNIMRERINEF